MRVADAPNLSRFPWWKPRATILSYAPASVHIIVRDSDKSSLHRLRELESPIIFELDQPWWKTSIESHPRLYSQFTRDSLVCKIIHRCFFKFPCSIKWEYVVQAVLIQSVVIHIRNIYFEDYIYTFFILFLHLLLFMYLYTLYFKNLKLF